MIFSRPLIPRYTDVDSRDQTEEASIEIGMAPLIRCSDNGHDSRRMRDFSLFSPLWVQAV